MSTAMSTVNLSILSFALSSWLDGSAQLRRSLIVFPLELGNVTAHHNEPSGSAPEDTSAQQDPEDIRLIDRCIQWLTRPAKDLDEIEKAILGALDVSSSILLLKLLGSGPILPFIMNPLSITLALPRKLSIGSVKWSQVILICILLSTLHEAQRTSVAAGLTWLRLKKAASNSANVGEVILTGDKLESPRENEEEEPCVICSGGESDAALSESISSLSSSASTHAANAPPTQGPLEAFCVHAPAKHPMHRACFVAWKDAYWDSRPSRPVITLVSDDAAIPLPSTWQWRRSQAVLSALGSRITQMTYFVPLAPTELAETASTSESTGIRELGESVFTLRAEQTSEYRDAEKLGTMVSVWPPCPGCRSSVKMNFARAMSARRRGLEKGETMVSKMLRVWIKSWKRLVTGRTILMKTATQVLFAAFLVSMMRMRKAPARGILRARRS